MEQPDNSDGKKRRKEFAGIGIPRNTTEIQRALRVTEEERIIKRHSLILSYAFFYIFSVYL